MFKAVAVYSFLSPERKFPLREVSINYRQLLFYKRWNYVLRVEAIFLVGTNKFDNLCLVFIKHYNI